MNSLPYLGDTGSLTPSRRERRARVHVGRMTPPAITRPQQQQKRRCTRPATMPVRGPANLAARLPRRSPSSSPATRVAAIIDIAVPGLLCILDTALATPIGRHLLCVDVDVSDNFPSFLLLHDPLGPREQIERLYGHGHGRFTVRPPSVLPVVHAATPLSNPTLPQPQNNCTHFPSSQSFTPPPSSPTPHYLSLRTTAPTFRPPSRSRRHPPLQPHTTSASEQLHWIVDGRSG